MELDKPTELIKAIEKHVSLLENRDTALRRLLKRKLLRKSSKVVEKKTCMAYAW